MGPAVHTDSSLLTILYQNNTRGLQIFKEGTGWLTIQPHTRVLSLPLLIGSVNKLAFVLHFLVQIEAD
ncbi:hypothetical protein ACET3Z_021711 [Daucus carota]